jgi:hypothetical protein
LRVEFTDDAREQGRAASTFKLGAMTATLLALALSACRRDLTESAPPSGTGGPFLAEGSPVKGSGDAATEAATHSRDAPDGESPDARRPETLADVHASFAKLAGRWRIVSQGTSARVTPGDCSDRIGKVLTVSAGHIAYAGDNCDDVLLLRLKTDCDVHLTKEGLWDFGRYQGDLQDLVHQEIVDVIDTGCTGAFQELLVLRSGELLTELSGDYYVLQKIQ